MKTIILVLFAGLLLVSASGPTQDKESLVGAWELVTATWQFDDTAYFPNSPHDREWKIVSEKNFVFIRQDTTDASLFFSGGGTYSFRDKVYTEHLKFTSWGTDIDDQLSYSCRFSGDTCIIDGPQNMKGYWKSEWKLHEKWIRIE